jgi:HD superfamily phosphohydrolase
VYATAREFFHKLRIKADELTIEVPALQFNEAAEKSFCAAAMCHDLGHTAFSHVLEKTLLPASVRRHEDCSIRLLRESPELRDAVEEYTGDLNSVALFIDRERDHPNLALNTLISGPFDVDRADYLIRDSQAAGVRYGLYDLSWLLHAAMLDINDLHQPILTFDGPRGMDALRQFLSARRYMYRNVYLHPTIRSAQLLLSKIFERINERRLAGDRLDIQLITLAPKGLQGFLSSRDISLEDFRCTTDVEVEYFIRLAAEEASDALLRRLCSDFTKRCFPKCVFDSGRMARDLVQEEGIVQALGQQLPLLDDGRRADTDVLNECREIVSQRLVANGEDGDLAKYLVYYERYQDRNEDYAALRDMRLRFGQRVVKLDEVQNRQAGYVPSRLVEPFELYRLFVPEAYRTEVYKKLARSSRNGS